MKVKHRETNIWMILFILILAGCQSSTGTKNQASTIEATAKTDTMELSFLFGDNPGFKECHASTLLHLKNGEFIAAWFGGTKEKDPDVGIWMTRGKPGHWEKAVEVAKIRPDAHWNPVLFQAENGKIFLFFKVGKDTKIWETWVKTSEDNGETWSDAYELVPGDKGGRGPVRCKPVILSNGNWITGASNEDGPWEAFFDISKDGGKTWQSTARVALDRTHFEGKGLIQPTIWEYPKGEVHAFLRSSNGYIYRTDSKDYGVTWTPAYKTSLENPNSGIDVVQLSGDTLALAYNPDNENWGSRGTLYLGLSFDNGNTWSEKIVLKAGDKDDEYSYPAVIAFKDSVAGTFTYNRKNIAFWQAAKKDILQEASSLSIQN